jgi:hypothetical protein
MINWIAFKILDVFEYFYGTAGVTVWIARLCDRFGVKKGDELRIAYFRMFGTWADDDDDAALDESANASPGAEPTPPEAKHGV